jgi:hypothetical protein
MRIRKKTGPPSSVEVLGPATKAELHNLLRKNLEPWAQEIVQTAIDEPDRLFSPHEVGQRAGSILTGVDKLKLALGRTETDITFRSMRRPRAWGAFLTPHYGFVRVLRPQLGSGR